MAKSSSGRTPKINQAQRRAANDAQFLAFLDGYEPRWRLAKMRILAFALSERARLGAALSPLLKGQADLHDGDVYGWITNGAVMTAIAELAMYVEDLLALLAACREREYFARNITSYDPQSVTTVLRQKLTGAHVDVVAKAFLVPTESKLSSWTPPAPRTDPERPVGSYAGALAALQEHLELGLAYYRRFESLLLRYKHGLSLAIRPFGGTPAAETIVERRRTDFGFVSVYSANLIATSGKRGDLSSGVILPNMDPAITTIAGELEAERNLLRVQQLSEVSLDEVVRVARSVCLLMSCILTNRREFIAPQAPGLHVFCLPAPLSEDSDRLAQIVVNRGGVPIGMDEVTGGEA